MSFGNLVNRNIQSLSLAGLISLGLLLSLSMPSFAAEKKEVLTLETVRIHGDQESPVVVYIVPWQTPEQNALDVQQANAVLRPLQPLDRESFQRMLGYHQLFKLQADAEQNELK